MDWLFGIDRERLPESAEFVFELGTPPQGTSGLLAILGLVAAIAVIVWIYRRESRGRLGRALAISLAAARVVVVLLLAFILTEPRLAVGTWQTVEARTCVLLDESLSMTVRDAYVDPERRQAIAEYLGVEPDDVAEQPRQRLLEAILAEELEAEGDDEVAETILERLAHDNDLYVYTFGDGSRLVHAEIHQHGEPEEAGEEGEEESPLAALEVTPRSDATDLGAALRQAIDEAGGEQVAAIVVVGDGRNNRGEDPESVAAAFATRGIPIHTVLIGDDAPPKNLRVSELLAPERVFASDPILFETTVEATGFPELEVVLELVRQQEGAPEEVVAQRELRFGDDTPSQAVTISHTNEETGEFTFVARVAELEGEITNADNLRSVEVEVIDDKTRVLLVSGGPSFDYRFVKELLRRESTVDLSVWLQSADRDFPQEGNTPIEALPFVEEEIREYDVILMMDMDPIELSAEGIEALRLFVEDEGGGLGFVCGEKFSLQLMTDSANRDLVDMLPIVPDDDTARDYVGYGRHHATQWRFDLTPEGADHPITRFTGDTILNQRIWERIPGIYWHLPVARARPGAKVLAQHSNPDAANKDGAHPLLVTHFFGPGRTLFLATDETYQWRSVASPQYKRFWLQLVRYLTQGKLLGGTDQVSLTLDAERVPLGSSVVLDATLRGADREPLEMEQVVATAATSDGDERDVTLLPVPGRPGNYTGIFVPWALGPAELSLEIPSDDGAPARGEASVQVTPPEREFDDSRADPQTMAALPEATGGTRLFPEEARQLADLIPSKRKRILRPGEPIDLWDTPAMVLLLLLFLSFEWILRKRRNLL